MELDKSCKKRIYMHGTWRQRGTNAGSCKSGLFVNNNQEPEGRACVQGDPFPTHAVTTPKTARRKLNENILRLATKMKRARLWRLN
jgi:hypothetical protein